MTITNQTHSELLTNALDVCGAILRRTLTKIDTDSAQGDDATARIAWFADAIDKCRNGRITRGSTMAAILDRTPRAPTDGNISAHAVKAAGQSMYLILDSFDA